MLFIPNCFFRYRISYKPGIVDLYSYYFNYDLTLLGEALNINLIFACICTSVISPEKLKSTFTDNHLYCNISKCLVRFANQEDSYV